MTISSLFIVMMMIILKYFGTRKIEGLYPIRAQRVEYAATAGASGISTAFNGRGYALDTLGGITGVEVGFMGQLLFPILGVVTAIGLTRRQEEAGRTKLLTASRVRRLAPPAAAALLLVLTCAVTAVGLTVSMAATGQPSVEAVTTKSSGTLLTASRWLIHTVCSAGVSPRMRDDP